MRDLRFWRWRTRADEDLDRELQTHLQLAIEEKIEAGLSRHEAELAARRELGSLALTKEDARDELKAAVFDRLWREGRQAARRLTRTPAFSLATVLTLALAIGANVAIFAVVHGVLLNPLPYPDSSRVVTLDFGWPQRNVPSGLSTVTSRLYFHFVDRARTLDSVSLHRVDELTLTGDGSPERIRVARTTPSLSAVLRVPPARGRWFADAEGLPGAAPVTVLSHGLWLRRYDADPALVGRTVTLNGVPTTVIGIMPAWFRFPDSRVDLWIAMPLSHATASDAFSLTLVARLRDAATLGDTRAELNRLTTELEATSPGNGYKFLVSTATSLIDATVGRVATALWILLAAAGLVLLVACANVANLFLVRSEARQREVAVRRALGAGTGGIAGFFFAESLLLSLAGGVLGFALAWGAVRVLVASGPITLPRLDEVGLDGATAAFTLAVTLIAALVFGWIPLLRLVPLAASLHDSSRGNTASRVRHRARQLLMTGQIGMALVLLVSSGLMFRSFQKLRARDPGFESASALTFQIDLPRSDYPDRARVVAGHQRILDRLSALPGVTAASAVTCLPLSGRGFCNAAPLFVEGDELAPGDAARRPLAAARAVAGSYVETMRMRIVRGRGIDRRDVDRNEANVVVNEALARVGFPGQDPIGRRIRLGIPSSAAPGTPLWFTIVGVVSNTPTLAPGEPNPVPKMYLPMFAVYDIWPAVDVMSYVVRTASEPLAVAAAVRGAVREIDPRLPLASVRTLQDILDLASAQLAFTLVLLAIAASVALMLGVIGVYGAMSYIVTQRTGEIGVRLALGAEPGRVAWMIVRQAGAVAVAGITVGLGASFAGSRLIESLLYGIGPRDPGVFAATALILLAVTLLASWLPARRAAHLSALEALRTE